MNKISESSLPQLKEPKKRSFIKTTMKWFMILLVFLLVLLVGAGLLLKIPSVQNKVAKRTMKFLSSEMNTTVKLDYISLDFFNEIVLDGFYVEDQKGDTLLYTHQLRADITSYPWDWIQKHVHLADVELSGGKATVIRTLEDEFSSVQFLIDKLKGNGNKKRPFILSMKTLTLNNLQLAFDNQKKGKLEEIYLKNGFFNVEDIQIQENLFQLGAVELNEPSFRLYRYPVDSSRLVLFSKTNSKSTKKKNPLVIEARLVTVNNGTFEFEDDRPYKPRVLPKNSFDNRHYKSTNIQTVHSNLRVVEKDIFSTIESLSFIETSGFRVEEMNADEFKFTDSELTFNGLYMKTPNSILTDTVKSVSYTHLTLPTILLV